MIKKITIVLLVFLLTISICISFVNVTATTSSTNAVKFFNGDYDSSDPNMVNSVKATRQIVGGILAVIRAGTITTAIVILLVIGIKYMLAAPGDRAGIKKYSIKYIIGALILFGASGIVTIFRDFTKESLNEYSSNP